MIRVSLKVLPNDVSQVLTVIEHARKPTTAAAYDALSKFANSRARNRHGQFVPVQGRKGSHMMRKTGT